MIDIHCHILPQIDDGAKDLAESLAMARLAVADGITTMVATPHFFPGRFDTNPAQIGERVRLMRTQLANAGIGLELRQAAEVRIGSWVLGMARRGELPWYDAGAQPRYFLLEFSHQGIDPMARQLVELLRLRGITPIIAHPERNRSVRKQPEAIRPFVELGCRLQITAASLTGITGEAVRAAAVELLQRGWVHFIASDGHGLYQRQPVISDGVRLAAQLIGAAAANRLVTTNPQALLNGEELS